jgi:hypothetical protein
MATKDSTPREWPDPTDFGLPFVEITPLSAVKPSAKLEQTASEVKLPKKETAPKPTKKEQKEVKPSRPIVSPASTPKANKPRSQAWVGVVIFGFLALISVIIWQLQSGSFMISESKDEQSTVSPIILAESNILPTVDTTLGKLNGVVDSIALPAASISGTTIAQQPQETLIRINSKEAKPRFFIIIGSFGSEEESLGFIDKMQGEFQNYFLIAPYADSKNFRLAIGKYVSWKEASSELERIKLVYPKDLWILNY